MPAINGCVLRSEDNLRYHVILAFYTLSNLRSPVTVSQEAESADSGQNVSTDPDTGARRILSALPIIQVIICWKIKWGNCGLIEIITVGSQQ